MTARASGIEKAGTVWDLITEDSLTEPASNPDPAVYAHASRQLGITPDNGIAVEDRPTARWRRSRAFSTIGTVVFVPIEDRDARTQERRDAGASRVVASWSELVDLLL